MTVIRRSLMACAAVLLMSQFGIVDAEIFLGSLSTRAHQVAGDVYLLSKKVIEIRGFTYDGTAPAAYFWADTNPTPSNDGQVISDGSPSSGCAVEVGDPELPGLSSVTQRVEFPGDLTIDNFLGGSLSVWCEAFATSFGGITIPNTLDESQLSVNTPALECNIPGPTEIFLGSLSTIAHQVRGDVYLLGERVLEIRGFSYDGTAPAAYFWVDTRSTPSNNGLVLSDGSPSSGCAMEIGDPELPTLTAVTQRVEFPAGLSINDFLGGSLSVWCEAFAANFGSIVIPGSLAAIPSDGPALECSENEARIPEIAETPEGYNCEELSEDFQVRWKVNGENLDIELVGKIPDETYMAFGVSGLPDRTWMLGADIVVTDMPSAGGAARARDFFMDGRAQCNGVSGVCSDSGSGFGDDVTGVSGEKDFGLSLVRYTRPLVPSDTSASSPGGQPMAVDQSISIAAGIETFIAWALGPIDPPTGNPFFHTLGYAGIDGGFPKTLEFGRSIVDNCQPLVNLAGTEAPTAGPPPPFRRPFVGDDETVFDVHIGPSGGPRGYTAITDGLVSWGIAWWVNGYLIPELVLRRGTMYTFRVNGGNDPADDAAYHPLYLTTSKEGGYFQLSPEDRLNETPLAGITITGTDPSTGGVLDFDVGGLAPICRYETTDASPGAELSSFEDYAETIDMSCADDAWMESGIIEFTPDESTPDVIYYHCVTHFNLGFKIIVIDEDAPEVTASPTAAPTEKPDFNGFQSVDLEGQIEDGELTFKFNPADARAEGQDTISIVFEAPTLAWVGWAVSEEGFMVGSEAVIGFPETGEVLKYTLGGQTISAVQPKPADQQTLIDASVRQVDGSTTLSFTKILVEPGEIPIKIDGDNAFLSSWGFSDTLSVHAARGSYLLSGEALEVREQSLWKAHGWLAAIAWGVLSPLAIASSVLRRFFPGDMWFHVHRCLNTLVVVFTLAAFAIAVAAINQETASGADPNHFDKSLAGGHRTIGLVIFVLALLQAIGGIFRPHVHANKSDLLDEENAKEAPVVSKSSSRVFWEYGHKGMGIGILALCWYQVQLGIKTYSNIFNAGDTGAMLPAFWAVAGTLGAMILAGYALKIVSPQK